MPQPEPIQRDSVDPHPRPRTGTWTWPPALAALRWLALGVVLLAACAQTGSNQMTFGRSIPIQTAEPELPARAPAATSDIEPLAAPTAIPYATPDLSQLPYEVLVQEVIRGGQDHPAVALTLDGGSVAAYTPAMLETLREHEVRITIFITGPIRRALPGACS